MKRNYELMRMILADASVKKGTLSMDDFARYVLALGSADGFRQELDRLVSDGLVTGSYMLDRNGGLTYSEVNGLTDEGTAFWRLIENDEVWKIVLSTLRAADVDVSYPLLKEVCEEIVRRYVTQFIPGDLGSL